MLITSCHAAHRYQPRTLLLDSPLRSQNEPHHARQVTRVETKSVGVKDVEDQNHHIRNDQNALRNDYDLGLFLGSLELSPLRNHDCPTIPLKQ
jgi:hypothetical protein